MDRRIVSWSSCVCALILLLISTAGAQKIITTVAGGGPNGLAANASAIGTPWKVVQQGSANVFFISDPFTNRVFEVKNGTLTVVAGNILGGYTADGQAATAATMNRPLGIAVDANNGLYIADSNNNVIRYVNTGTSSVQLFGGAVTVAAGEIITIAGTGTSCADAGSGACGDGGSADSAKLFNPSDVSVDSSNNIYIADTGDNVIRVVNGTTGTITPLAGNYTACTPPNCGDNGLATSAMLNAPFGVWLDSNKNVYVADTADYTIRVVNTGSSPITIANITIQPQQIAAIAGSYAPCGAPPACGDGNSATSSMVQLTQPIGVSADSNGNVYIADTNDQVVRIVNGTTQQNPGVINLLAGSYAICTQAPCGDGGAANAASLWSPTGVLVDTSSNLYIADQNDDAVREIQAPVSGTDNISTAFGIILNPAYSGDGKSAIDASFHSPSGVATDGAGNLYIADAQNNVVRVVNNQKAAITVAKVPIPAGAIATIAGTGQLCNAGLLSCGYGGAATAAQLAAPSAVALDAAGNIYIADSLNSVISEINAQTGILTIVAGDGGFNYLGDGGPAASATLDAPFGLALDHAGNIYIADANPPNINGVTSNNVIRVVNRQTAPITVAGISIAPGNIDRVAGTFPLTTCTPTTAPCGDDGPARSASLNSPIGLAVDSSGNIYIADLGDNRVRFVKNSTGIITTIAGTGTPCSSGPCGDGSPATSATLDSPFDVLVDSANTVYVSDLNDFVVRSFTVGGNISRAVGSYNYGFFGDGGAATSAGLAQPTGLGADFEGNLFVTDVASFRVREVSRLITTPPTAALSGNQLAFPDTVVSSPSSPSIVTVTNNGNGTNLTVSSIAISGTNASDFKQTNNCSTVAPDGGTCTVTITFTPSASGPRSATLKVTDNAADSPQTVLLSGTGVVGLQISPTSQSVSAGSSANYTITVPSQGFGGSVTLSCTAGLPSGAACSFSPNPVAPGKSSTLTITTTAPSSAALIAPATKRSPAPFYAVWLLLPAMLLSTAGLTAPKRKKLISYFLLTLAIAGVLFLVACGGGSSTSGGGGGGGGGGTGGTPAGTYTITVQGKAGSTTSTQKITLTVQ